MEKLKEKKQSGHLQFKNGGIPIFGGECGIWKGALPISPWIERSTHIMKNENENNLQLF